MDEPQPNGEVPPPKVPKKAVKVKKIIIKGNSLDNSEINEVLRDALREHLKRQHEIVKSAAEIDAMVATCQEFMQSFMIFGYDFDGNPVEPIFFAHNQQEADALSMYLTKFINSNFKSS